MIFFKLLLLKSEVNDKSQMMSETWEKSMYASLIQNLENSIGLFRKKKEMDIGDFDLKVISSTFSGIITELLIHRILIGIVGRKNKIDDIPNPKLVYLVNSLETIKETDIDFRHEIVLSNKKTDADILIRINESEIHCISVKNRPIGSCYGDLMNELEIFKEKSFKKVYVLANLLKTKKIDYDTFIRDSKLKFPELEIIIFDIREFIDLLVGLDKNTKSLITFNLELYSILDY